MPSYRLYIYMPSYRLYMLCYWRTHCTQSVDVIYYADGSEYCLFFQVDFNFNICYAVIILGMLRNTNMVSKCGGDKRTADYVWHSLKLTLNVFLVVSVWVLVWYFSCCGWRSSVNNNICFHIGCSLWWSTAITIQL